MRNIEGIKLQLLFCQTVQIPAVNIKEVHYICHMKLWESKQLLVCYKIDTFHVKSLQPNPLSLG